MASKIRNLFFRINGGEPVFMVPCNMNDKVVLSLDPTKETTVFEDEKGNKMEFYFEEPKMVKKDEKAN